MLAVCAADFFPIIRSVNHTAYIALGSNVGDRQKNLADAIARLDALPGIQVMNVATPIDSDGR